MKVLAVTTWYPSPANELMGVFVRKDTRLLAQEHEVELLHLAPPVAWRSAPQREQDGPVRVTRLELDVNRPDHHARARREILRRLGDVDVLHTMAFSSVLPLTGARVPVPWVHTEHWSVLSTPGSFGRWRHTVPLLGRLLAMPDVVVPVCEFLARPVRAWRTGPVHVVPCLVDRPADPVPRPPADDVLRLVGVGALVPRKGPALAVDAVAELARRGRTASLTWVGAGPLHDQVLQRAAALGVADRVRLVGHRDPDGVVDELARADLFVLPTQNENFCVSAAEAIRAGRPAVVGSHGGQDEYVDETNGALVTARTGRAYADAVLEVEARLAEASADDVAARVRERFSAPAVRAGYREAYAIAAREHARRGSGRRLPGRP